MMWTRAGFGFWIECEVGSDPNSAEPHSTRDAHSLASPDSPYLGWMSEAIDEWAVEVKAAIAIS